MLGSRGRRTSKRSERPSSPAGSAASAECGRWPRLPVSRRLAQSRGARSICSWMAWRRALQAFRGQALRSEGDTLRGLWLAWLLAGDLWDDEAWHELATHAVRLAREAGALNVLPVGLEYRAGVHIHAGE